MHTHINAKPACGDHDSAMRRGNCEFCSELLNHADNRFRTLYGPSVSRAVLHQNGFVVIPTIGQLFEASMLVLPIEHIERMADLEETQIHECLTIIEKVAQLLSFYGSSIICEHGARATTGGGCGIYHAHFHVVPIPANKARPCVEDLMPNCIETIPATSLLDALQQVRDMDEYLLLKDADGRVAFLEVTPSLKPSIPSQFFRRSLVECYDLSDPWDWRSYGFEKRLVSTIDHFRSSAA